MCTHCRTIKNHYTGKVLLVPCGKCEACREQKAMSRAQRIKNTYNGKNVALFVTLTYSNEFVPYILRSDLPFYGTMDLKSVEVPIYRDAWCRRVRYSADYDMTKKVVFETKIIGFHEFEIPWCFDKEGLRSITNGDFNKISVPYFKDLQDFEKRLSIFLFRSGYRKRLQYFQCNEMGPSTYRSHHHLLIFVERQDVALLRKAIIACWPFGDLLRNKKRIQIARNAASYVAKYVNSSPELPRFFTTDSCRQKHSYSHGFGIGNFAFTLDSITKGADKGDLSYFVQRKVNGVPTTFNIPIPEYALYRYFPKFKGYSRISGSEIRELVSGILQYAERKEWRFYYPRIIVKRFYHPLMRFPLDYANSEYHLITVRLKNAFMRCKAEGFQGNVFDYAQLFERVWRARSATVLRLSFDDVFTPQDNLEHYDNLFSLFPRSVLKSDDQQFVFSLKQSDYKPIRNDSLLVLCPDPNTLDFDPNHNPRRILQSSRLCEIYRKSFKKRKITDYVTNCLDVKRYQEKLKLYNLMQNETR